MMAALLIGPLCLGKVLHDLLGDRFAIGATSDFGLDDAHDLTHVGAGGGSGFGDGGCDDGADFFGAHGGGKVFFEDGDFSLFGLGELAAVGGFKLLDGVLSLLDLLADNGEGVCMSDDVVFVTGFDGGVGEGRFQGAEGSEGNGILGLHGGLQIFHDCFSECAHVMVLAGISGWCKPWSCGRGGM